MPAYTSDTGLNSLVKLPKVQIVHPEHAPESYLRASGEIDPGDVVQAVTPAASAVHGKTFYEVGGRVTTVTASAGISAPVGRFGVAMKEVQVMTDERAGSLSDGPIEFVNAAIAHGDFLRVLREGTFFTTKVEPDSTPLFPGELVTWNGAATRPTGMTGTGAWVRTTAAAGNALAQVVSFKEVGDSGYAEFRLLT
jgi:hypothetical protein